MNAFRRTRYAVAKSAFVVSAKNNQFLTLERLLRIFVVDFRPISRNVERYEMREDKVAELSDAVRVVQIFCNHRERLSFSRLELFCTQLNVLTTLKRNLKVK